MASSIKELDGTSNTYLVGKGEFEPEMDTLLDRELLLNIVAGDSINTGHTMRSVIVFFGVGSEIGVEGGGGNDKVRWACEL